MDLLDDNLFENLEDDTKAPGESPEEDKNFLKSLERKAEEVEQQFRGMGVVIRRERKEGKPRKDGDGRGFREDKRLSRGIGAFSRREKPCGGKTSPWSRGGAGLSRSRRPR